MDWGGLYAVLGGLWLIWFVGLAIGVGVWIYRGRARRAAADKRGRAAR